MQAAQCPSPSAGGPPGPPPIVQDEAGEPCDRREELSESPLLPDHVHVAEPVELPYEIDRPVTRRLVRDVGSVGGLRVPGVSDLHVTSPTGPTYGRGVGDRARLSTRSSRTEAREDGPRVASCSARPRRANSYDARAVTDSVRTLKPFVDGWAGYQRLILEAIGRLDARAARLTDRALPVDGVAARRPHGGLAGVLVPRRPRRGR